MLTDFHMHSNLSDGNLSIRELVDLYGKLGFGAIAITDHLCEQKTFLGKAAKYLDKTLQEENFNYYLEVIQEETERAKKIYNMLVIPGVEITKNSLLNHRSAHILILGIKKFISADLDIDSVLMESRNQGAVSVAAHPVFTQQIEKQTYHLWDRKEELKTKIDLWEVASGQRLFPSVVKEKLPMVANSDLHRKEQVSSWKTRLSCEKYQDAVLEDLRKQKVDFYYYDAKYAGPIK
jgi:predicted metal-dependent phosphoesterase TrpH